MEGTANLANPANTEEVKTGAEERFRSSSKDSQDSPDSRCLSLFAINHQLSTLNTVGNGWLPVRGRVPSDQSGAA